MRNILRRSILLLCIGIMLTGWVVLPAMAAENPEKNMAEDISGRSLVTAYSGARDIGGLFNKLHVDELKLKSGAAITLSHEGGIGSLYLVFVLEYGVYTVTNEDTGESHTWGEHGFLHEFLDLEEAFGTTPTSVTLHFDNGDAVLNEIYAFTSGETPTFVQKWEPPLDGKTDLVLFSTHGDDEQLFFAGLLPYYAVERDYQVQVVYLTNHRNVTLCRTGEMLNGLWAVGVKAYPVFGTFFDFEAESLPEAYLWYEIWGTSKEELLSFVVEQIRRFRPKVAVGHDFDGEYGHYMHILYTDLLVQALEISNDETRFPELAEKYGVWDVPKTYIHLYPENPIVMDWDTPLESFDDMTAFEVTKKLGFPCHLSQQIYFDWYFSGINRADEIQLFSPCKYGLYRSTVGLDVQKNDFFENLTTHEEDAVLEQIRQEEARREEEARQAEETARKETQAQPLETEPRQMEVIQQEKERPVNLWIICGTATVLFAALVALISAWRNRKVSK